MNIIYLYIYKIENIQFRFKYILIPKFEILVLKIPAFYELNIIYILYYNVISTFLLILKEKKHYQTS